MARGAWGTAHGVENLKSDFGQNMLRSALCALLYAYEP
jgi:hypothetical protein